MITHFDEDILALATILTIQVDYRVGCRARAAKVVKCKTINPNVSNF